MPLTPTEVERRAIAAALERIADDEGHIDRALVHCYFDSGNEHRFSFIGAWNDDAREFDYEGPTEAVSDLREGEIELLAARYRSVGWNVTKHVSGKGGNRNLLLVLRPAPATKAVALKKKQGAPVSSSVALPAPARVAVMARSDNALLEVD